MTQHDDPQHPQFANPEDPDNEPTVIIEEDEVREQLDGPAYTVRPRGEGEAPPEEIHTAEIEEVLVVLPEETEEYTDDSEVYEAGQGLLSEVPVEEATPLVAQPQFAPPLFEAATESLETEARTEEIYSEDIGESSGAMPIQSVEDITAYLEQDSIELDHAPYDDGFDDEVEKKKSPLLKYVAILLVLGGLGYAGVTFGPTYYDKYFGQDEKSAVAASENSGADPAPDPSATVEINQIPDPVDPEGGTDPENSSPPVVAETANEKAFQEWVKKSLNRDFGV